MWYWITKKKQYFEFFDIEDLIRRFFFWNFNLPSFKFNIIMIGRYYSMKGLQSILWNSIILMWVEMRFNCNIQLPLFTAQTVSWKFLWVIHNVVFFYVHVYTVSIVWTICFISIFEVAGAQISFYFSK
jgi:hypothetical protein